ncbi:MAG: hypothetical protein KDD40_07380, partial [Bdellovibrionales bacterium]|nr:hypothetical protein [Bdellovibrionales bacterium]
TNIAAGNFNYGFSGDGIFVENNTAGGNSDDVANGIAVDSSGNKIVVGYSYNGGPNTDAVIWKLLPNGTLDSSFGTAGRVVLDQLATTLYSGASDYATDVAIDSNGKIVVVGYSYNNTPNLDMFALRLNNDGSLDTSFNGTGKWAFDNAGGDDKAYGVKVNASNQIYITGVSYYGANGDDMVVVKLNNDGSNDAGFNGGSPFNHHNLLGGINEGGNDLVILPNSDILVAGYAYNGSYNKAVVWKVVGDGSGLSGSFAGSGAYSYACAMDCVAEALTVDDSGDIFINGYSMGAFSNMMVLKLKADGSSLDSTFASAGVYIDTSISAGNGASFGYDIALDGAQNIVVAGRSYEDVSSEFRLAVWRLTPGGNLEGSFAMGTGVFHSSTLAGGPVANDSGNALVIENDGRIFVAGQAENGTPNFDMVVVAIE